MHLEVTDATQSAAGFETAATLIWAGLEVGAEGEAQKPGVWREPCGGAPQRQIIR